MKLLAQSVIPLGPIRAPSGDTSLGPFGTIDYTLNATGSLAAIAGTVSAIIGLMTIVATIWFMFQILIGGISWITSGGDKSKLQTARDRITNAFIGLIIVVAAWAIVALVGKFFGLDFILLPANLVNMLRISGPGLPTQ